MTCKHFGTCGSCGLFELSYVEQLQQKVERVSTLLSPFTKKKLEVFDSPSSHYRARAEFRIWHEGDTCYFAMGKLPKDGIREKGSINISECPKVILPIEKRMWQLLDSINASSEVLKKRLFSVEFLATSSDECLITMIYHRKLDETWSEEAKKLEEILEAKIMGRSRKQKVIISDEFVIEKLIIDHKEVMYKQYESGFTQPNPLVNIKMIEWAVKQAKKIGYGDFLEAYCGLGNFTLPLSHYFDKVLATEISKNSIQSALQNCALNSINNITFARLSSEEMTEALSGVRVFNRLKDIDLASYHFSTVLVDPPRAGLDMASIKLISTIENIIYISCNPETLARDLETLSQTHSIEEGAIYDQFPHTSHVESGVFLRRKNLKV
ncbi:tRNA (Uracil54-C5-)-methyltransferase [hydrothermal vent metagenome]|uniref:tRNA (Uracil54-C5-)-methyltransferase n=1 Tax=hydrothermal vent metagenome TaxID=652676 RepID=A0A1W1CPJ3_9ZZZZ